MAVEVREGAGGKVLAVTFHDKITRQDYHAFVPAVNRAVRKHRKVRLLIEMADVHGWSVGALWEELKLDLKHFDHVERLALVGDQKWESGLAAYSRMLGTAVIRHFDADHAAEARAWVREGLKDVTPENEPAAAAIAAERQ
jgi:hypothetical protein